MASSVDWEGLARISLPHFAPRSRTKSGGRGRIALFKCLLADPPADPQNFTERVTLLSQIDERPGDYSMLSLGQLAKFRLDEGPQQGHCHDAGFGTPRLIVQHAPSCCTEASLRLDHRGRLPNSFAAHTTHSRTPPRFLAFAIDRFHCFAGHTHRGIVASPPARRNPLIRLLVRSPPTSSFLTRRCCFLVHLGIPPLAFFA